MKFTITNTTRIKLNLFLDKLFYLDNEEREVDEKLPLDVKLISHATLYTSDDRSLIDYSPTTLGYYWINENKCLRTSKGLVFKEVKKDESIQAQFNTRNHQLIHQAIDWEKSIRPKNDKTYTFEKTSELTAQLNKSDAEGWHLKRHNKKLIILKHDLEFLYWHRYETGFELNNRSISYYGQLLIDVDVDSFRVLNCNYALDKHTAFCGGSTISNVDLPTFSALSHSMAKDKNHVYYSSSVLKHADPDSLELFDDHTNLFFKDKNHVFSGDNVLIGADVDSFEVKGEIFGIDKNHVYRSSKRLHNLDVSSFEIINEHYVKDKSFIYNAYNNNTVCENDGSFEDLGSGYFKTKNSIYYVEHSEHSMAISNDCDSFEVFHYGWAKDCNKLFLEGTEVYQENNLSVKILDANYILVNKKALWRHQEIENADMDTFANDLCDFAIDKNAIYHAGDRIENSDPHSFQQLDDSTFIDKNNVYLIERYDEMYLMTHIKGIDTENTTILPGGFLKTQQAVYYGEDQVKGADPLTFKQVEGPFFRDKNAVYCSSKTLVGLKPDELRILNYQFACDKKKVFFYEHELHLNAKNCALLSDDFIKDNNNVYYQKKRIQQADANSFEVINGWFQKDKYRLFHRTIPLELNPVTVKVEDAIFAYDEKTAYFSGTKIEGVDIASYEVLGGNFSRDKFNLFFHENRVNDVDAASFEIMGFSVFRDKNNAYTFKHGKLVIDRQL